MTGMGRIAARRLRAERWLVLAKAAVQSSIGERRILVESRRLRGADPIMAIHAARATP